MDKIEKDCNQTVKFSEKNSHVSHTNEQKNGIILRSAARLFLRPDYSG